MPTRNAELFWALRGGGGNFGVVTAFTFQGHPVGTVLGGPLFFGGGRAADVLAAYAAWAPTVPDDMSTMLALLTAPPAPFVPDELRGRLALAVLHCHPGDPDEGRDALDRLRRACPPDADATGPFPYPVLQTLQDAGAPHGIRSYWKSGYLPALTAESRPCWPSRPQAPTPVSQIHVQQLGGAIASGTAGAVGHRDAAYVVNILGNSMDPAADDATVGWVRDTWQRLQPHTEGAYLNFLDGDDSTRVQSAFAPEAGSGCWAVKAGGTPTTSFGSTTTSPSSPCAEAPCGPNLSAWSASLPCSLPLLWPSARPRPPAQAQSPAGKYAQQAFVATNANRSHHGLKELKPSDCLKRAAVQQAKAMARQEQLFHQDLGAVMRKCKLSGAGENVAYGYPTGKSLVNEGWMQSEGHRANILNPKFRLMGIGARLGNDGRWYVSQVFGRKG